MEQSNTSVNFLDIRVVLLDKASELGILPYSDSLINRFKGVCYNIYRRKAFKLIVLEFRAIEFELTIRAMGFKN